MNVYFRKAEISDVDLYYKWTNDEEVRKNSYQQDTVVYENHVKWFTNKLVSQDCFFYLFLNENKEPVGQVRIDKNDNEVIIGISIDKGFRGLGLGNKMLLLASNDYLIKHPKTEIHAYIKVENESSYSIFKKAGFTNEQKVVVYGEESYKLTKS